MKLTPGTKLKYVGAVFNKINETHNPADGIIVEVIDGTSSDKDKLITIKPELLDSGGNLIPRLHFHMEDVMNNQEKAIRASVNLLPKLLMASL